MVYTCIKEHGLITKWGLKRRIILSANNNSSLLSSATGGLFCRSVPNPVGFFITGQQEHEWYFIGKA